MLQFSDLIIETVVANQSGIMEVRNHFKRIPAIIIGVVFTLHGYAQTNCDEYKMPIDSATEANHIKNDPVSTSFDPVNDPVNSFHVLELIKANPQINYDKLVEKQVVHEPQLKE